MIKILVIYIIMDIKLTKEILTKSHKLSKEFIEFNSKCFSPYHSVAKGKELLIQNGF